MVQRYMDGSSQKEGTSQHHPGSAGAIKCAGNSSRVKPSFVIQVALAHKIFWLLGQKHHLTASWTQTVVLLFLQSNLIHYKIQIDDVFLELFLWTEEIILRFTAHACLTIPNVLTRPIVCAYGQLGWISQQKSHLSSRHQVWGYNGAINEFDQLFRGSKKIPRSESPYKT